MSYMRCSRRHAVSTLEVALHRSLLSLFLAVALLLSDVVAQTVKPSFEVVSVKRQLKPFSPEYIQTAFARLLPGGVFRGTHVTVESLLLFAHPDLSAFQIVNAPDWARRDLFEINATAGRDSRADQVRIMVRSLLEERFKLVAHREQREMGVEKLVRARPDGRLGPYVQKVDECTAEKIAEARQRFSPRPLGPAPMSGCTEGFQTLAASLTGLLGTPVLDDTRVTDRHLMEMRYSTKQPGVAADDPAYPPIRLALEEQLGLRLEPHKGPIDVLVIDSVEQPTEN